MARIDQSVIARVYDTANIVDVVQDYVSIKKRGANYIGLCPFHNEKTGSFTVSPSKGIFKCFGCGESGNVVSFIEKIESCSFPEAIHKLAQRYHIEVIEEEMSDEMKQQESERQLYFRLNEFALHWFERQLWETDEGQSVGLAYLRGRHLRDDIIKRFQLGYAPNRNAFLKDAVSNGFSEDDVIRFGLCARSTREDVDGNAVESTYDRFRERVMYPWFNPSGKVVAFNGRLLREKKNAGKYVNTPEVKNLFEKRRELFGILQARKEIEKQDFCYLVEGQMDVISMVQAGVENVVASSGTALTREQVRLIKRYTQNVVVLYDGDSAGQKASKRGNEMFLRENMNVKLVSLPAGEDPDSLSHKMSLDEFKSYLERNQTDFIQYNIELVKVTAEDNPFQFGQLVKEIGDLISFISDPISRKAYIKSASKRLDIDEKDLETYTNHQISERIREEQKEQERESMRNDFAQRKQEDPPADAEMTFTRNKPAAEQKVSVSYRTSKRAKIERTIVDILVKYGREKYLTYDDGTNMTVAEYIFECLDGDNIRMSVSGYDKIINEYKQHAGEEHFDAEHFFITHSDPEVVEAVSDLSIERYQLSRMFSEDDSQQPSQPTDPGKVITVLPKVMLQLKVTIIDELLENIMLEIRNNQTEGKSEDNDVLIARQMQLQQLKRQILKMVNG